MEQPGNGVALYGLEGRKKAIVVIGTLLGLLVSALNQTVVGTALPRIVAELGGLDMYSWVLTSFMLTSTTAILVAGRLSDMYGRKPFYMAGIAIFMTGSALCGVSQSIMQLILFRGFQGIGGGIMMGNAFAIIGDLFPPAKRAKYQGLFTSVFGLASVIGPLVGGFITDNWTWRAVFYLNLPIGFTALAVLWFGFPWRRPTARRSIDYPGAVVVACAIVPLLLAMVWAGDKYAWTSPQIVSLLSLSAAMVGLFLLVEQRAIEPVLPLALFRGRIFTVCSLLAFLTGMGMFGTMAFMPLFMQGALGDSATNSGVVMIPMMMGVVGGSIASGQIVSRLKRYRVILVLGSLTLVVGMYLMSLMTSSTPHSAAIRNMLIVGAGLGITMPLTSLAVQNSVSYRLLGIATSSVVFFRSIGGTIGIAVFGTMMTGRMSADFQTSLPQDVKAVVPPDLLSRLEDPQILLSPSTLDRVREGFGLLGADGPRLFEETIASMRSVVGTSLGGVFFVGFIVAIIALIVSFLVREIPLRTSWEHEPAAEKSPAEGYVLAGDAASE